MTSSIFRIPFKFKEYKEKKLFLDCDYNVDGAKYRAHKIVLANNSSLLANFFKNSDSSTIPIPFREDLFDLLINYFYDGCIKLPDNEVDLLIPLFSMSIIYDVPSLRLIVWPLIAKSIQSGETNYKNVLNFTRQYKSIKLNPNEADSFPGIGKNYTELLETQREFVQYLVDNFDTITTKYEGAMEVFFMSVTPFLLSEVLKKLNFSNEKNAAIIDNCVKTIESVTEIDRRNLQSVINWNDDSAYLLFSDYNMDWVTPDISRPFLERLLDSRLYTSDAFINESKSNEIEDYVNNWYTISWIQNVRSSKKVDHMQLTEVFNFIGRFGDEKGKFHNPILYELVESECSPNLGKPTTFGAHRILDQNENSNYYYTSKPVQNQKLEPRVGASFLGATFNVESVELYSVDGKKGPIRVELELDNVSYDTVALKGGKAVFKLSSPKTVNKIVVKMIEPKLPIMRVRLLKANGFFSPMIAKTPNNQGKASDIE